MARPPRSSDILTLLRGLGQVGTALVNIKSQEISFKVATSSLKPLAAQGITKLQETLNNNEKPVDQQIEVGIPQIVSEALERFSVVSKGIKAYTTGTVESSKPSEINDGTYDPIFDISLMEINPEDLHLEAYGVPPSTSNTEAYGVPPPSTSNTDTTSQVDISKVPVETLQQMEMLVDKSKAEIVEKIEALESLIDFEGVESREITEEQLNAINETLEDMQDVAFGHNLKIFREVECSKPLEEVLGDIIKEQEARQNKVHEKYDEIESNVENVSSANKTSKDDIKSESLVEANTEKTQTDPSFINSESPPSDTRDAVMTAAAISAAVSATEIMAATGGVSAVASVAAVTAAAAVSTVAVQKIAPYLKNQSDADKHVGIEDAVEVLHEASTEPLQETSNTEPVTIAADGSAEITISNKATNDRYEEETYNTTEVTASLADKPLVESQETMEPKIENDVNKADTKIGKHEINNGISKADVFTENELIENVNSLKSNETSYSMEKNAAVNSDFDVTDKSHEAMTPTETTKSTTEPMNKEKTELVDSMEGSDANVISVEQTEVLKEKIELVDSTEGSDVKVVSVEATEVIKENTELVDSIEGSDVKVVSVEATEVIKENTELVDSIEGADVKVVSVEATEVIKENTELVDSIEGSDVKLVSVEETETLNEKTELVDSMEGSDVKVVSVEQTEVIKEKTELVESMEGADVKVVSVEQTEVIKDKTELVDSMEGADVKVVSVEQTEVIKEKTELVDSMEGADVKIVSVEQTEVIKEKTELVDSMEGADVKVVSVEQTEVIKEKTELVDSMEGADVKVVSVEEKTTLVDSMEAENKNKDSSTVIMEEAASISAVSAAASTVVNVANASELTASTKPSIIPVKAAVAMSKPKPKLLGKKPLAKGKPKSTLSDNAKARKVPYSRLGRMMTFGGLAAGLGAGTIAELTRRTLGFKDVNKTTNSLLGDSAVLSEANAKRIVETLCKVRGAALKLGQMMSIQDNALINPQLQKIFERVRQSADFMPIYQLEQVLIDEFGSEWRSKVSTFDERPFAAASIGQVHLATLEDGRSVAMKIQYPGVADGIESDINNLMATLKVANVLPEGLYVDEVIEVAKKELSAECDYYREAECTERFRKLISPYPEYYVPEVVKELCSKQVFTTELIDGVAVDKCLDMDQDTRNYISELMLRLCFMEVFQFGFMQTDPNWSNFFFNAETQQFVLLDFGACREYRKSFVDDYIEVIHGAAINDREKVLHYSTQIGFLTGHEAKVMQTAHVDSVMILGEAFRSDIPFAFGLQDITRRIQSQVPVMLTHRMCPPPEETYSLHRKMSGVFLLVARLNGIVDCKPIFDDIYNNYQWGGTWEDVHSSKI